MGEPSTAPMLLTRLVAASAAISATRSRSVKVGLLAAVLLDAASPDPAVPCSTGESGHTARVRRVVADTPVVMAGPADADHVPVGPADRTVAVVASYLAGVLPQGRIGVGWRQLTRPGDRDPQPDRPKQGPDRAELAGERSAVGSGTQPQPTRADSAAAVLTVLELDDLLTQIAGTTGQGSAQARARLLAEIFERTTAAEREFVRALVGGGMRQGASEGLTVAAVAAAAGVPEGLVQRALMLGGELGPVAVAALTGGAQALAAVGLRVGRPLRPMLAASAPDVASALAAHPDRPVVLEAKLDGIRIQIHKADTHVRVFTRGLEEISARLPQVVSFAQALPCASAVLDGEALALAADGRPLPFQVTSSGGARQPQASGESAADHPVLRPFVFDLLHLDGRDLLDEPASQRHAQLEALVAPEHRVATLVTADPAAAEAFFADTVATGHEGVVIKDLEAPYAAGRRGSHWIKVKPRHTLDLVVLAVEWGSGRRTGWLSNIHLGARDPETGGFVMLGKTFKGMTDEMLAWQTQRFLQLEESRTGHVVQLHPEQVVEVAFDGLQTSRRYPGGLALRFARVVRYRLDKSADEADTIATVRALARPARTPTPTARQRP